jgi:hypothetical protein
MSVFNKWLKEMAPQVGLEPTTLRLTAGCSAIELLRSVVGHIIGNRNKDASPELSLSILASCPTC